ncbi:Starch-binding associating with outer membrane [Filimonas lacunae]|uniref:Starch-binding associating with outer membrane n=2 Tax=Filimonas lacunae TaxID=477680 RepID=A0A1N7QEC2_9BACT|nr:Starch-binding associating with outer membrane [Filimonas lacunae]
MNYLTIRNFTRGILPAAALLLFSCKKTFEVLPETTLDESQMYRNIYDADAAIIGIYGKLETLAEQYVVLNELRGDLITVTENADTSLQQLNEHAVVAGNKYADPRSFYQVIFNCNDVLKNLGVMLEDKKITQADYNARYSDIGALRSWLYLQLGIHFGEVPYITTAPENVNDIKNSAAYPRVPFATLLQQLIAFTEQLPVLDIYPSGSSLVTTVDGYATQKFFINRLCVLGDLYLWNGDYRKAATTYRAVMETGANSTNTDEQFNTYKIRYADVANNNDLAVGYIRYREQDLQSLINNAAQGWKSMFIRSQDALWNEEWIWVLPFSKSFAPENPFINLFAADGGSYLLKPSRAVIRNWNSQVQNNGFPFDARKLFSIDTSSGRPVVMKYSYNYSLLTPLEKTGNWFLYRAAQVHLHYAEAANRDGEGKVAWALLNQGIATAYDNASVTDKTNLQQTFEPAPYNFDGRYGTAPYFRGPWHRNGGIRGRAYLTPLSTGLQQQAEALEEAIVNESALELAFEGNRWPDLLRIALRKNDASFLAEKVGTKLQLEGNAHASEVKARLLNKANWYLPFNW